MQLERAFRGGSVDRSRITLVRSAAGSRATTTERVRSEALLRQTAGGFR